MAGGSPRHNFLSAAASDGARYMYSDAVVVCGGVRIEAGTIIVSHRERRIDHYHRLSDGQWHLATHVGDDALLVLPALGGSLPLVDVYREVDLGEGRRTLGK